MTETNKAILARANAAVAEGDIEGFLSFCTDDTNWVFVGDRTLAGKEAVRRWMRESYLQPPDNKVHRMVAEGDFVVAFGDIAVKGEGGAVTRSSYCDVWRFREGKMDELKAFVIDAGLSSGGT